jgi:hypothetical protein
LPKLRDKKGNFTKDALVLVYLAKDYPNTQPVTKTELTNFIRTFFPNTNDVQQARHLAAQKGWYINSGTRGNGKVKLKPGTYQLFSLEKPYPNFNQTKRVKIDIEWDGIKQKYDYRCATCGSKEGEQHFHWKNATTKLQKAHKDPRKELEKNNIIPQCQFCNRAYRDFWVFDDKGRISKIANANVVLNKADGEIQYKIYKILYNKYKGRDPNEEQQAY